MAWRDSRRNKARLFLFISSIILGIASLVAINSFSENLQTDINKEAKSLLGADMVFDSNRPPDADIQHIIDSIEGEKGRTINFPSMVYYPKGGLTRLALVRAFEGNFPYYGTFTTEPVDAYKTFKTGGKAVVDRSLMIQFGMQPGDSLKVGEKMFEIEGTVIGIPGSSGFTSSIAPAVFIPMEDLDATNLVQVGSRLDYLYYFKLDDDVDAELLGTQIDSTLEKGAYDYTTVEERREDIGEAFSSLGNFLNLVGFIALLLGCIGVASSVHIYVKDKLNTVAVLRCLGTSGRQAFAIYLIQILIMGLIGAVLGALLGSVLQVLLPKVLGDFLPLANVSANVSASAIIEGIVTGLLIALLFALLPLLAIRKTSPLRTLRASFEENGDKRDYVRWVVYALIFLFVGLFTYLQTDNLQQSLVFPLGIAAAFLILAGIAKLTVMAVRKFFPSHWSFIWRQSIANLYRPNNQTLTLIVSIGLGTALISTLFFTQEVLLNQVEMSGSGTQPNMILYDIQPEQKDAVAGLVEEYGLPLRQQVPIVTIRLDNIDGLTKMKYKADTTLRKERRISGWIFDREYRVTYRDTMIDTEVILEGAWHTSNRDSAGFVPVSISTRMQRSMSAEIGTRIDFNVQGAIIKTRVASIREVDFTKIQTNFFVVFPTGVLEKAPQFNVIVSWVEDPVTSAKFQQALITQFPNVSAIDLTTILETVDNVLTKVTFVIRFMALFSILTGLLVLVSSVILSKYQRIKESVLLRTIGAKGRQILWINALEYFVLGALAALTGIVLAFLGSFLLAKFSFEVPFTPSVIPPFIVFIIITGLTVLIGLFNSTEIIRKPPLEVLRSEI